MRQLHFNASLKPILINPNSDGKSLLQHTLDQLEKDSEISYGDKVIVVQVTNEDKPD